MTILTINGTQHDVEMPNRTILEVLRNDLGLTGAKLGCGEGECGACTILVDGLAVCACLQLVSSLEGKQIETVEALCKTDLGQEITGALARHGAIQCGLCTPGIVVSATGQLRQEKALREVDACLEGNLCRCTGYTKIRKALLEVAHQPETRIPRRGTTSRSAVLAELRAHPDIMPVAGGTDLMVKHEGRLALHRHLDLTRIDDPAMTSISADASDLSIGALVTWSQINAAPMIAEKLPILKAVARGIGGLQVRNAGTLGGNIATASPAGDSLPALVALQARVEIDGPQGERTISLEDLLLAPGKTALGTGELIVRVLIPIPTAHSYQVFRKVGPRQAQAIAKLSLALIATAGNGRLQGVHLAFGAVGPVPMACPETRALLLATPLQQLRYADLERTLGAEIAPIDDFRSTKAYRLKVAPRLLWRELERMALNEYPT